MTPTFIVFVSSFISLAALGATARPALAQGTSSCAAARASWSRDAPPARTIALAECEASSGRPREVAALLATLVRTGAGDDDERARARSLFDAARARVASVGVESDADAAVVLDGVPIGRAPIADPVFVEPGRHTFTATLPGRAPARRDVEVRAGEAISFVLRVIPLRDDVIGYDAPADPVAAPPAPRKPNTAIILGGGSLAAVALGAAFALNLVANANANIARDAQASIRRAGGSSATCDAPSAAFARDCSTLHDALSSHATYGNLSVAGYVVAGTAALATLAYIVWPARGAETRDGTASVRAAPMAGVGFGGVQIAGRF